VGQAQTILGVKISTEALAQIVQKSMAAVERQGPRVIFACANPHSLVVAQHDANFYAALTRADFVVADGIGLSLMARLTGMRMGPRITGTDYFHAVMNALQRRGSGRVFFFGSSQQVLDLIARRFAAEFPSLTLCGVLSPPFGSWGDEANRRMVGVINDARPDVLWVGMTAPKQESWVGTNGPDLNVSVIGCIGAVFDFYAGTHSRAPRWIRRTGLEWAYRLALEPRRMWRRNVISAPKFAWLVLKRHLLRFSQ
jgi:N-acetylglucosaminyldiphosphoundecaprenol N-acetyl-beta-D-mannosaminyltransferase